MSAYETGDLPLIIRGSGPYVFDPAVRRVRRSPRTAGPRSRSGSRYAPVHDPGNFYDVFAQKIPGSWNEAGPVASPTWPTRPGAVRSERLGGNHLRLLTIGPDGPHRAGVGTGGRHVRGRRRLQVIGWVNLFPWWRQATTTWSPRPSARAGHRRRVVRAAAAVTASAIGSRRGGDWFAPRQP
jgi:hypothetical protein